MEKTLKKTLCALCAALVVLSCTTASVLAKNKDRVDCVVVTLTNEEIQARIDALNAKNADIIAKHAVVKTTHTNAKAALIGEKTNAAIAKHDALIKYYMELLKN